MIDLSQINSLGWLCYALALVIGFVLGTLHGRSPPQWAREMRFAVTTHLIALTQAVRTLEEKLMATLDEILAEVTAQTTKIDSIDTLLDGMRQQIADLIAAQGNVPAELQAKIDAVFVAAQANSAKIDTAIAENTPPEPPVA